MCCTEQRSDGVPMREKVWMHPNGRWWVLDISTDGSGRLSHVMMISTCDAEDSGLSLITSCSVPIHKSIPAHLNALIALGVPERLTAHGFRPYLC